MDLPNTGCINCSNGAIVLPHPPPRSCCTGATGATGATGVISFAYIYRDTDQTVADNAAIIFNSPATLAPIQYTPVSSSIPFYFREPLGQIPGGSLGASGNKTNPCTSFLLYSDPFVSLWVSDGLRRNMSMSVKQ